MSQKVFDLDQIKILLNFYLLYLLDCYEHEIFSNEDVVMLHLCTAASCRVSDCEGDFCFERASLRSPHDLLGLYK